MFKQLLFIGLLFLTLPILAVEYKWHGVVDIRATNTDSIKSYLDGGYGKLGNSDGNSISLAQFGSELIVEWDSGISAHLVTNAYADEIESTIGITEGFFKYRSLPNSHGYRWQTRLGIFYPEISLENNAFAWASRNTLSSSSINTWIGEEIRVLGSEFSLTRLGKFHDQAFDISISGTAFINNDPAGSLLSWHGWNVSSRQTLWTESREFPQFPARMPGYDLHAQAEKSDPFLELDNDLGFHFNTKVKLHRQGQISFGYYNNNGTPYIVKNGQYAWRTRFSHVGIRWRLPLSFEISVQFLTGDTLMQSDAKVDIVNNDYKSGYVALTKRVNKHRVTARIEEFSVTDNDDTRGDNNSEYGQAATVNYTYRYSKPWFISIEYNWVDSRRPSRMYSNEALNLTERQWQLSSRYFF